ncbi:glycosyltransferase [Pseudoalteromonas sp. T1lg48]|uniref:glycosyltransferase n=1 Tax=Pseudoalteromonas sp. T1lg48 TaxID=2077100 RepID=UPI000CF699FB|nr:glycosyltransferase [Pseudoalteromonas sp. T1lg48]
MNVEVLISTLNNGLENIKISESRFSYLIIHQVTDHKFDEYKSYFMANLSAANVRYIQMKEPGLSKSRNFAIKHSIGDILWIMDDDVHILPTAYEAICTAFESCNSDLLVFSHKKIDRTKFERTLVKDITRLSAAGVSSIDMCLKAETVKNKVLFDENFGLGTKLPSGEEFIFTSDLLKEKSKVNKVKVCLSHHPDIASGDDFFSTPEKIRAKRKIMRRVYGHVGELMFIAFVIKKAPALIRSKAFLKFLKFSYT